MNVPQLQPHETVERCGLILANGDVIEVRNVAASPQDSYEMDPLGVLPYLKDMVATWHTHPNGSGNLSGEDHKGFLSWPKLMHLIISSEGVRKYQIDNGAVIECD